MISEPSVADLILSPAEEAWVERLPDGRLVVRWRDAARQASIYAGDIPDDFSQAVQLAEAVTGGKLAVASPFDGRPYFLLDFDGRRVVVAERTLPLVGGVNFRDVGGYRTDGGRAVRWGQVYRAGSLAELTDEDVTYLGRLGVRLSCDLRAPEEAQARPDQLPSGAAARRLSVAAEVNRLRRIVTLFRKRHRIQELLLDVYTVMIDQNGPLFAEVLRLAAEPANRPLVIHCTAGKDRTGLAVALLLLALGVDEETVIVDYTLSNHAYEVLAGRMRPEMARLFAFGFSEEQLRPFLLAEARTLASALAHLRRRYGSVEGYLLRSGLEPETVERARQTLLVA